MIAIIFILIIIPILACKLLRADSHVGHKFLVPPQGAVVRADQDVHQRALPRPVRSQQSVQAVFDFEGDAVQGGDDFLVSRPGKFCLVGLGEVENFQPVAHYYFSPVNPFNPAFLFLYSTLSPESHRGLGCIIRDRLIVWNVVIEIVLVNKGIHLLIVFILVADTIEVVKGDRGVRITI